MSQTEIQNIITANQRTELINSCFNQISWVPDKAKKLLGLCIKQIKKELLDSRYVKINKTMVYIFFGLVSQHVKILYRFFYLAI